MRPLHLSCAFALLALLPFPAALTAQIAVVGSTIHEHAAGPGQGHEGSITVRNTSAASQEVRLYQTDYRFTADGRSSYEPPSTTPRSNAAWLVVSPERVTIPAGQTVTVHYRVAVPEATPEPLQGSYWSLVMVEGVAPTAGADARRGAATLRTVLRYAVQVVTHIGTTGVAAVQFESPAVTATADGTRALAVDITNVGERASRLQLTLELFDDEGRSVGTFRQPGGLAYPGTSRRPRFALGTLPAGSYTALLLADGGGDAVFGAQYTLKF